MSLSPLDLLGVRSANFSAGSSQYPAADREVVSFARSVVSELANNPNYRFTPYVLPPLPFQNLMRAVANDKALKRIRIGGAGDLFQVGQAGGIQNIANVRIRSEQWPKIIDMLRARSAEAMLDQQLEDYAIRILQKAGFGDVLDTLKSESEEEIRFTKDVISLVDEYVMQYIQGINAGAMFRNSDASSLWYSENMHFEPARFLGSSFTQRIHLLILDAHFIAKHGYSPHLFLNDFGDIGNGHHANGGLIYNIRDFQFGKYKIFEGHAQALIDASGRDAAGGADSNSIVELPDIAGTCHLPLSPEAFIYFRFGPGHSDLQGSRRLTLRNRNAAPGEAAKPFGLQSFQHDFAGPQGDQRYSLPESVMLGFDANADDAFNPLIFNFSAMKMAYCAMASAFTFAAGAARTVSKSTDSLLITTAEPFIGFYNGIQTRTTHEQTHQTLSARPAGQAQNSLFYGLSSEQQFVDDLSQAAATFEVEKNNARRTIDMVRRDDLNQQFSPEELQNKEAIRAGDVSLLTVAEAKYVGLLGKRNGTAGANPAGEIQIEEKFTNDNTDAMLDAYKNNVADTTLQGFKQTLADLKASLPTMTCADKPASPIHAEKIFEGVLSIIHEYVSMIALSIQSNNSTQAFIAGPANLHAIKVLTTTDITDLVRARIAELKTPDYLIAGEQIDSAYVKMGVRDLAKLTPVFRYLSPHTAGLDPRGTPLPDADSFPFGNDLGQQEIMALLSKPTRTKDINEMLNFGFAFGQMLRPSVNGSLLYFETIARDLYRADLESEVIGEGAHIVHRNARNLLQFQNGKTTVADPPSIQGIGHPNDQNVHIEVISHRVAHFFTILESVFSGGNTSFIDKLAKLYLSLEEEAHKLSQNADDPLGSFCDSTGRFYASGALPQNIVYTLVRELKRLAVGLVPDIDILCCGVPADGQDQGHASWNQAINMTQTLILESMYAIDQDLDGRRDYVSEGTTYIDLSVTLDGLGPEQFVLVALGGNGHTEPLLQDFLNNDRDLDQVAITAALNENRGAAARMAELLTEDQRRAGRYTVFAANSAARIINQTQAQVQNNMLSARGEQSRIARTEVGAEGRDEYYTLRGDDLTRAVRVPAPQDFAGSTNEDFSTRAQQLKAEFDEYGAEAWTIIRNRRMCFKFDAAQMMQIDKYITSMLEHLQSGKTTPFASFSAMSVPNTRMSTGPAVFQPYDQARNPAVMPPEYAVSEANGYRTRAGRPTQWSKAIQDLQKNKVPFDKIIAGIEIDLEANAARTQYFDSLSGMLERKALAVENSEIFNAINGFLPDNFADEGKTIEEVREFIFNVLRSQPNQSMDLINHSLRRLRQIENIVKDDPSTRHSANSVFCNFIIKYINSLLENPNTLSPPNNPVLEPTKNFINSNLTDVCINVLGTRSTFRDEIISSQSTVGISPFDIRSGLAAPIAKFGSFAISHFFGPIEADFGQGAEDDLTGLVGQSVLLDFNQHLHFRQLGTYIDEKSLFDALNSEHIHLALPAGTIRNGSSVPTNLSSDDLIAEQKRGLFSKLMYYVSHANGPVNTFAMVLDNDFNEQQVGEDLMDLINSVGANSIFGQSEMQYVYLFEFVMKKMIEIIYGWDLNPEFVAAPSSEPTAARLSRGRRGTFHLSGRGRDTRIRDLITRAVMYLIPPDRSGSPTGEYSSETVRTVRNAIARLYPLNTADNTVDTASWERHLHEIRAGNLTDSQVLVARAIYHSRFSYFGLVMDLVFENKPYYTSINFLARPTKGDFQINHHLKNFIDDVGPGMSQEDRDAALANRAPEFVKSFIRMAYPTMHTNGGELILNEDGSSGPGFDTFIDEFSRAIEEIRKLAAQADYSDIAFTAEIARD